MLIERVDSNTALEAILIDEGTEADDKKNEKMKELQRWQSQVRAGISLDSTTDFDGMHEQVSRMAVLENMDIYLEHSFDGSSESNTVSLNRLMKTIGSLPKLRWLRIRSSSLSGGQCMEFPYAALEICLKTSTALKYLHLSYIEFIGHNQQCQCPFQAIASLMKDNSTIDELRLKYGGFQKISTESQQLLLSMLQYHNFTLECLDLDARTLRQVSTKRKKELAFWLALNQKGTRKRLLDPMSNPTQEQWQDVVIDHRKRTSVVYYLLSHNPTLLLR